MSDDVNSVKLKGRLAADAETKATQNGSAMLKLRVATCRNWKGKEYTDYHTVVAWGELGSKYGHLCKGDQIEVEGRLSTRKWDSPQGVRWFTEVHANSISADTESSRGPDLSDDEIPF
jgi:single stranded DNA-binding protein